MPAKIEITVTEYILRLARELYPSETPKLRGFFGNAFRDEILLHHHKKDGSLLYTYPLIQFKILDHTAFLIGLKEGSKILSRLWFEVEDTRIGTEKLPVLDSKIVSRNSILGVTAESVGYRFLSPWLALNRQNERRYADTKKGQDKLSILEKILVGNCLSISKAFGITVDTPLKANCSKLREVRCSLKGTSMRGFGGIFYINFDLPDRIGIGKSVSRGFGTIERLPVILQKKGV